MSAGAGNSSGGLSLVPSSHLMQQQTQSHVGPATEPITPPPPQVSHSNLSQVARAHPYAAALPSAPLPSSSRIGSSGGYIGQSSSSSSMPSSTIYSDSQTFSGRGGEPAPFPLRSPPDRSGEYRRRLTLLPHSGLSPMGDGYSVAPSGLSGPGPGGGSGGVTASGRHHLPSLHSQMNYTTTAVDAYREPLMVPMPQSSGGDPAHKKLRLGGAPEPLLMKATMAQPLRIDTRPVMTTAMPAYSISSAPVHQPQPAYIPQVEAISPTLPGDGEDPLKRDDSPLRSTKDELLQQITKVNRYI